MKRKLTYLVSLFVVLSSILAFQGAAAAEAEDDITGIKLEKEMRQLIELGILKGYEKGKYEPFKEITRGQFAAFVARALDLPEGTPAFSDVPQSATLAKEIYSAAQAGIVNGYLDNTFKMNQVVTREQMAAMINNALTYKGVQRTPAELNFTDADQISSIFKEAVANNVHDGIINGFSNPDGTSRFAPQAHADRAQAAAFIARMLNVLAEVDPGSDNEEPGNGDPVPPLEGYVVATIDANKKLVLEDVSYDSFNEAKNAAVNANQVVTHNGKIVSMHDGIVLSGKSEGEAVTLIYTDENFKIRPTYVAPNQELGYLESTEKYVKANLAGMTVYVKPEDVTLIPNQMLEARSYYTIEDGDLYHHVYNHDVKGYSLGYVAGKAPSFLEVGKKYYSWDGITFYNEAGTHIGSAHQYFTFLPLRTTTSYTAEEIDRFIDYMLKTREDLYNRDSNRYARYEDVMNKSKLKDLGAPLKAAEEKYRINALFILSIAFNESDYGISEIAQEKNNLFGLNAVDSNEGLAYSFETVADSIDGLAVNTIIGKHLALERTFFANGAIFGNKSVGMNVVYAADPYWGQKNAGYMYRADKYLGSKEYGKYELGLTNTTGLNVRSEPNRDSTKYYTYPKSGMPLAIIGTETGTADGATWYKIVSEHIDHPEAYVHGDYVTPISFVE